MTNEKLVNVSRRGQKRKSIQPTRINKNGNVRGVKDGLPRSKPSIALHNRPRKSANSVSVVTDSPGKVSHRTICGIKKPGSCQKVSKLSLSATDNSIGEDIQCFPPDAAGSGKVSNSPKRSKELGKLSRHSKTRSERVRKTNMPHRKGKSGAALPLISRSEVVQKAVIRGDSHETEEELSEYPDISSLHSDGAEEHEKVSDEEHWDGRAQKLWVNNDVKKCWDNESDQRQPPLGDSSTAEWENNITKIIDKFDDTSLPSKNTSCLGSYCDELKPERKSKESKRDVLRPRRRKGRDANKGQYKRRLIANARERNRVHTLGRAFEDLRGAIPSFSEDQKLSKLTILKLAISYISALDNLLHYNESSEARLLFAANVNDCTSALQTEYGRAKRKYRDSSDAGHY